MAFGLTSAGFTLKRLQDAKAEIQTSLRGVFGPGINLREDELLGQMVGIISEQVAIIWEGLQAVYNSQDPDNANGVPLDRVMSYTGIERLEATKGTGTGKAYGTLGTVVTAGSVISVDGNPDARAVVTADATIAAGTNEIQDIDFSAVPDAGAWTLVYDGEETGSLAFNDNAAAVQSALNALAGLSGVTVSGNYSAGFTVTFAGADGSQPQVALHAGANTLSNTAIQVNLSFAVTTAGVLPNVAVVLEAETAGNIPMYANTLTVIETPISGWDSFNNATDFTPGNEVETDAEARVRRERTLATAGAGTVEAMRSRLLEIDEVEDARVFENDTSAIDGEGRPPKSMHAVVVGGADADIAEAIWDVKPGGIELHGDETEDIVDSQGYERTIKFDRPATITVHVIINLTTTDDYPADGDTSVRAAVVDWAEENQGIALDVFAYKLSAAIEAEEIDGITKIAVLIGLIDPPTTDVAVPIGDTEIADIQSANVDVNS